MLFRPAKLYDLPVIISWIAELKYPRISLNVYKNNPTAMQLYQSLGFRVKKNSKEDGLSKDICYMETVNY